MKKMTLMTADLNDLIVVLEKGLGIEMENNSKYICFIFLQLFEIRIEGVHRAHKTDR